MLTKSKKKKEPTVNYLATSFSYDFDENEDKIELKPDFEEQVEELMVCSKRTLAELVVLLNFKANNTTTIPKAEKIPPVRVTPFPSTVETKETGTITSTGTPYVRIY